MDNNQVLSHLVDIAKSLSVEQDTTKLLEKILFSAKQLANADGGTIYSIVNGNELRFDTLVNDSMGSYMGGSSGVEIPFPTIPLYEDGEPNTHALVAYAAASDQVINIEDAYSFDDFNMSAAREFDRKTGYRTKSLLTIPMKNHEGDLNGVLQLINAQQDGEIIPFAKELEVIIVSLASLAAVALTNRQLIDGMEELFDAFTKLIAKAIDEKSPYTGGHCRRVPELTLMIADAVHDTENGPLADFNMTEKDRHQLSIAGWLHDCGKIATPEYVMDKSKKLECVFDRIELVDAKFEIAIRDIELAFTHKINACLIEGQSAQVASLQTEMEKQISALNADREFLRTSNFGGEFMSPDDQKRIAAMAENTQIVIGGNKQPLLSSEEIYNLQIARGTLNNEERATINRHMDVTIDMLEALPFPKHLKNVPEYAGGHHEKMDGTGYPKGLTRDEMSVQARVMAIADIFEALTASDRPYKPAKKVSECLKIMAFMKKDNHIDPDLFDVFVDKKVYLQYAERFLSKDQLDEIDELKIPGYIPPEQR